MTKPLFFGAITLVLTVTGLAAASANATQAQRQAAAITTQDRAGRDATAARAALQAFVQTHLNASTSLTLSASYQRAQAAAQAAASATVPNAQVYANAQAACAGKSDSITQARCNQQYLATHLVTVSTPTSVLQPKLADYQYTYHSPRWTPDLAGASLAGALVALVLTLIAIINKKPRYR